MESLRFEFQPNTEYRERSRIANPVYRGRNGDGQCTGIAMLIVNPSETPNERLRLAPYNSKGIVSTTCFVEIPGNSDTLKDVAVALIRLAATSNPSVVAEVQSAMTKIASAFKENSSSHAHT